MPRSPHPLPPRGQDEVGHRLVGMPLGAARRGPGHGGDPLGVARQRDEHVVDPGGVSSASATSRPPPARTTPSALSRCSPLPMGSGT